MTAGRGLDDTDERVESAADESAAEFERLRAENARLRAALADDADVNYQRVLEDIPAPVFVTAAPAAPGPRGILLANRAALKLLGARGPEEVLGRDLLEFVHPDDRADAIERGERAAQGLPIAPVSQGRFLRLDGSVLDAERSVAFGTYRGRPAFQSVIYDVSRRVRTEEALAGSEARFRDLAESALLGLCVVSYTDPARILYVNRAFKRIFGFADDADLLGMSHIDEFVLRKVFEHIHSNNSI